MAAPVKLVKDQLVQHAELAVVGESPGKEEIFTGQPFVGPSGSLLNNLLYTAGLRRTDVAVLNVSQRRPSFKSDDIKLIPRDELEVWKESLRHRLTLLPNLKVVVPLGNTALEAVLGSKAKLSKNKTLSISKAAGFYYENVELDDGRRVLVIPAYHPAATFRDQTLVKVCEEIWLKIGTELKRGLVAQTNTLGPLLDDTFKIESIPHPDDALDYAHEVVKQGREAPPISFDIETPRDVPREKILCVGFSNDGKFGMTIPYDDHRAVGPKEWRDKYQEAIRIIVTSEVPKLGQNLLFDTFMLTRLKGMWVPNVIYDTRMMHLVWDPRREHSLSAMVSHMFRARMWKDREEDSRVNDDYGTLAEYCAQDALRTWHVAMWLRQRLENDGLWSAYDSIYRRRFYPLLRISLHGLAINQKARHEIHEELEAECEKLRAELAEIAGVPLSGGKTLEDAKSLSDRKVSEFLYGPKDPSAPAIKLTKTGKVAKNQPPPKAKGLALKPILDKDTGKPTSNEVALKTLRLRVEGKDERAARGIDLILAHREKHQMSTFVVPERVDRDNRFRSSFGFAETGRLTSSANPVGTGANAQNASRAIRRIFIPDPGCVFVSVDLSCVEDRIIKCYSKDTELIRLARLPSYEYDAHSALAAFIFNVPVEKVTKDMRNMGKKVRHASQRNVKGQRFADELLKEGTVKTKKWCDEVLEGYHKAEPGIRAGYFPYVTELVMKNKELVSPWGYRVSYRSERVDDDLLREAFSFLPQAGAVFTLDLQGFIAVDDLIEAEVLKSSRINNEVHDSVTVSCPLDEAYHVAKFLVTSLSQPNDFDGVELSVPAEAKVGASLDDKDSTDWKKFPSKEEFDKVAEKWLEVANKRHRDCAEFVKTMPKVTYGKKKTKKK